METEYQEFFSTFDSFFENEIFEDISQLRQMRMHQMKQEIEILQMERIREE